MDLDRELSELGFLRREPTGAEVQDPLAELEPAGIQRDVNVAVVVLAGKSAARGGRVGPLACYPDDGVGVATDRDRLTDRVLIGEEGFGSRVGEHCVIPDFFVIGKVEEASVDDIEVVELGIVVRRGDDAGVEGMLAKVNLLEDFADRQDSLDRRDSLQDALVVFIGQAVAKDDGRTARAGLNFVGRLDRPEDDIGRAELLDAELGVATGPLGYREHRNDCRYAEDQAQGGQARAKLVHHEALQTESQPAPDSSHASKAHFLLSLALFTRWLAVPPPPCARSDESHEASEQLTMPGQVRRVSPRRGAAPMLRRARRLECAP